MTTTRVIRRIGALAVAMCAFEPVSAADYFSRLANDPAGSSSLSGTGSSAGWATSEGGARAVAGMTEGNRYFACYDESSATHYIRTPTSSWTMPANSSLTVQEDCYQMLAVICDVVNTIPSDPPWRCGQVGENRLVVRSNAVAQPKALRYLFSKPWYGALRNEVCLPLGPFACGDVPDAE